MTLDFNTPVCQHPNHEGQAVPAHFRLEHADYGVRYYCNKHPTTLIYKLTQAQWTATPINQHTQPAQERG